MLDSYKDTGTIIFRSAALTIIVVLGGYGLFSFWSGTRAHAKESSTTCIAQANEKCFPKLFLDSYQEFLQLQTEVSDVQKTGKFSEWQHKQRELTGFGAELSESLKGITPQGYRADLEKMKFVLVPPPPVAPSPAAK